MAFKVLKSLVVFGSNGSHAYSEGEIIESFEGDAEGLVREGVLAPMELEKVEPITKPKKVEKVK